ncbi:IS3 family transposase [Candidatus Mycoplasma pogonae]
MKLFFCIKSESLNFIDIFKITFEELKQEIETYTNWYNNERLNKF